MMSKVQTHGATLYAVMHAIGWTHGTTVARGVTELAVGRVSGPLIDSTVSLFF